MHAGTVWSHNRLQITAVEECFNNGLRNGCRNVKIVGYGLGKGIPEMSFRRRLDADQ